MRLTRKLGLFLALAILVPLGVSASTVEREGSTWATARRDASGLSPDPTTTPEAVVQVFAARTYGWRGAFAVHTWIAVKREGAPAFRRFEVEGWGVNRGAAAVRIDRRGPDNYWHGSRPDLLADRRGEGVEALIERIEAAVQSYPHHDHYVTWPGPNSNTFTAHVLRHVPELGVALPTTAIGKDYLLEGLVAATPSGTGFQVSLLGLLGVSIAKAEGFEVNLLGLTLGIDPLGPAISLPGIGRIGP
jgi:hypothetical protein